MSILSSKNSHASAGILSGLVAFVFHFFQWCFNLFPGYFWHYSFIWGTASCFYSLIFLFYKLLIIPLPPGFYFIFPIQYSTFLILNLFYLHKILWCLVSCYCYPVDVFLSLECFQLCVRFAPYRYIGPCYCFLRFLIHYFVSLSIFFCSCSVVDLSHIFHFTILSCVSPLHQHPSPSLRGPPLYVLSSTSPPGFSKALLFTVHHSFVFSFGSTASSIFLYIDSLSFPL